MWCGAKGRHERLWPTREMQRCSDLGQAEHSVQLQGEKMLGASWVCSASGVSGEMSGNHLELCVVLAPGQKV